MRRVSLLLVLSVLFVLPAHARRRAVSHPPPFAIPEAEAIAAAQLQQGVPGITIAVRKGTSYFTRSWGDTHDDSVYQIASITKQFTAAAIMRLAEEGRLRVEDKARTWLPELDARFDAITIEHLLRHRSGLRNYNSQLASPWVPKTQSEIVALITNGPPRFTPGSQYEYSNSGYFLLGMIIERASSKSYPQFLRETFFEPLGLRSTSYCGEHGPPPDGWLLDADGTKERLPAAEMSIPFAAGAICSTADDLLRWTDALASGVAVSPESYARMTTPVDYYGYGLVISTLGNRRRVWHNGAILGFQSHAARYVDEDLTIVVLIDALDPLRDRATAIANAVAGHL